MARGPVDLGVYSREVEAGLPNEQERLNRALKRQSYYDYDGFRYETDYRRDAESSFDFQGRSHRGSGFLRECIEILTEHLYLPGPARRWDVPGEDALLQQVWADNHIDAILLEADRLSTLNDWCGVQIDPGAGDFAARPITYRLWGREQLAVWTDPNNPTVPEVVCTIDKYDQQRRYKLWSDTEVWTFLTAKLKPMQTSGGRLAVKTMIDDPADPNYSGPHPYGCLPFSFVHYTPPIRDFEVSSIGGFLLGAEVRINDRLSRLDESIHKHLNPIPVAEGMPSDWKPNVEPGRFLRVPRSPGVPGLSGGYEKGEYARLYYLSVDIDVNGAWEDCRSYMNLALEAARVPLSAARMEQTGVASGIALMVEQEPLLKRAEARRPAKRVMEQDLASRTLTVIRNHYGRSES